MSPKDISVPFVFQDGHNLPGGGTAVRVFSGGATAHALQPADSLLPLPGQAHCASAEKQHGVSPFFTCFDTKGVYLHMVYKCNIYS